MHQKIITRTQSKKLMAKPAPAKPNDDNIGMYEY